FDFEADGALGGLDQVAGLAHGLRLTGRLKAGDYSGKGVRAHPCLLSSENAALAQRFVPWVACGSMV
ncbi:MAG: hypothetical protein K2X58_12170, partial [Pseudomonadaceae bacterium]|nr:hypothetical protein [Pseudomonadaceae bacterium]